jgi:hypothetical protein
MPMPANERRWAELQPRRFSDAECAARLRWERSGSGFIARYRQKIARDFPRTKPAEGGTAN